LGEIWWRSGGRLRLEVGVEERHYAWPFLGGSDTRAKRGRWLAVVAFIAARWGGGRAEEGAMRRPRVERVHYRHQTGEAGSPTSGPEATVMAVAV
jgi:hypothetical protein